MTPLTTKTGLRIGSRYTPPPPLPSADEEWLQRILLDEQEQGVGARLVFWLVALFAVGALVYNWTGPAS
jgi:hypothetical protein